MLYKVRSLGLQGISGYEVTAECDLASGLPNFDIVGLPEKRPGNGSVLPSRTTAIPSRWGGSP